MSHEQAAAYETMEAREHRLRGGLSDEHFIADPVNLERRRGYASAWRDKAMEFFYYFTIFNCDGADLDDPMTVGRRKARRLHVQGNYSQW